jgi:hypothetical protein
MIQSLKKIVALSMALTVLVSSHSFAYFEHLCTITNIKKVSFVPETCAGEFKEAEFSDLPTLKKGTCCEISYKVNKAHTAVQEKVPSAPVFALVYNFPVFKFSEVGTAPTTSSGYTFGDSSPPSSLPLYLSLRKIIR